MAYIFHTKTVSQLQMNAITALGVLVGLLLLLLAVVTAGWMWTCWTMNYRGGTTFKQDYR